VLWQDDRWRLCQWEGYEVPGWLFLELRRHAEGLWSLNRQEREELGDLLWRTSLALRKWEGCEKVYAVAFGENVPHFHVLLVARTEETPPSHRGGTLVTRAGAMRDPEAAAAFCAWVRRPPRATPADPA
jgi:diadenosine tetraphosphate (Ap4A) HIT family hydrolase